MKQCSACGKALTRRSQKQFCSVRCQIEHDRSTRTATWLATGVGQPRSDPRHYMRLHILDEQDGCCAICGIVEEWNGRALSFVLDHVDGHAEHNGRANLRLICPNCDSQLDTYKSRNRGNGRHARRQRYADGLSS